MTVLLVRINAEKFGSRFAESFERKVDFEPLPQDLVQLWNEGPLIDIERRYWEPLGELCIVLSEVFLTELPRMDYPVKQPNNLVNMNFSDARDRLSHAGWRQLR